jgi:hypothetical protein
MYAIGYFQYFNSTWKRIQPYFAPPLYYRMPQAMTKLSTPDGKIFYIVTKSDSWNGPLPIVNDFEYRQIKPVYMGSGIKDGFMPADHP